MNLQDETDRVAFQSRQFRNIIHSRVESISKPGISMVILFIPTDVLQRLSELIDDENGLSDFSSMSDVLAASIAHEMRAEQERHPLTYDGFIVDPVTRQALVGKNTISLPRREFDLLWFFARHPRCVFTRSQLLDYVWGHGYMGTESTVTVHIRRLRKKIEPNPNEPIYLHTVWGVGYMFDPD